MGNDDISFRDISFRVTFWLLFCLFLDPELGEYDEGCLSVPGYYETVNRPKRISVTAQDREGQSCTRELDGLLAICLQHEVDHLEGKLFVDYLSPLKRQRIRKKLEKDQRNRA